MAPAEAPARAAAVALHRSQIEALAAEGMARVGAIPADAARTIEEMDEIIDQHLLKGVPVERLRLPRG